MTAAGPPALTEAQVRRYARHILLPDVGGVGQQRLLAGSVEVTVGPHSAAAVAALAYLAAAGVGRLYLAGPVDDAVTAEEAAGGILFGTADVGRPRLAALRARLVALNPDVTVVAAEPESRAAVTLDRLPEVGEDVAAALRHGGGAAVQALARLIADPR